MTSWYIISGGQTGVDRAALDAAIAAGIPHSGMCPRGRRAEDGRIADEYQLTETPESGYHVRTEQNVIQSDATLILYRGQVEGGTKLTHKFAQLHRRPCFLVDLQQRSEVSSIIEWLKDHDIQKLNIAGPRESSSRGIGLAARGFLDELISALPS